MAMNEHKLIGKQLGYYKLKKLIGVGGMGAVYVGVHAELEIEYAVKVLMRSDSEFIARFKREAQRAALLDHPNIVKVFHYGYDTDFDVAYLVMTLVDGLELRDMLDDGPLDVERAANIAIQVADALAYAHAREIIHRDIKPDNILLHDDDRVKIVDFGLAKLMEEQQNITASDQVLGTPEYMAIEQWEGLHIDHRVDIHALGVTLYEMLTGKQAFTGTPSRIFTCRLTDDFKKPHELRADLPKPIVDIVLKMMARHANDRYQTAADVIAALSPFADSSVLARMHSSSELRIPGADGSASGIRAGIHSAETEAALDPRAAAKKQKSATDAPRPSGRQTGVADSGDAIPPPGSPEAGALSGTHTDSSGRMKMFEDVVAAEGRMLSLYLPRHQNFTCQHSGQCCSHWQIPVGDDKAEAIAKREWGGRLPHLVNESPFVANRTGKGKEMALDLNGGHCPFHDTDGHRCVIHEVMGGAAKPLGCQQFPYRFTVTPAGTFVGLSFSCPTVRKSIGKAVVDQASEVKEFTKRAKIGMELPAGYETVALLPGRKVEWSAIVKLEKVLDEFLADTSLPLHKVLIAGERLTMQLQVIAEKGTPEGKQIAPPEKIIEHLRGETFARPKFTVREKLFWAQVANLLKSRREIYWSTHSAFARAVHWLRGLERYFRLLLDAPWGMHWQIDDKHDKKHISLSRMLEVSPALPPDGEELVRRFIRVKLFGNDFFGPAYNKMSFIGGYRFMMVAVGFALFLARSRAAVRGHSVLEWDDVDFAIGTISDCFYSTNTLNTTLFGTTVEAMMTRRPAVARKFLLRFALDPEQSPESQTSPDDADNEHRDESASLLVTDVTDAAEADSAPESEAAASKPAPESAT